MFFNTKKKRDELTKTQIDYARELYRMYHERELKPEEITKENIERIITEYTKKLLIKMNEYAKS